MLYFYLVEYNNKRIGIYDDYDKANTFILSCLQNNLMQNFANILTFRANSCYHEKVTIVTLNNKEEKKDKKENKEEKNNIIIKEEKVIDEQTVEQIEKIAKEKIEIQHNINLLKIKKEQLEESKKVYENDIKLFKLFQENKNNNPDFIIPELFEKKYKIFDRLNNENRLSWDNFYLEHNHENNYDNHFLSNDYENKFIETPKDKFNNIDEEIEIETDSNTDESY